MRSSHGASSTVGGPTSAQFSSDSETRPAARRGDAIRLLVALSSLRTGEQLTEEECAAVLHAGDYGLRLVGEPDRFVIQTTDGETVARLAALPSLWQLYTLLIDAGRTRRNYQPGWLHDTVWQVEADIGLAGCPELTPGGPARAITPHDRAVELRRWRSLDLLCRRDAIMRLHAVTRVPADLPQRQSWHTAPAARPGLLHPPHPAYPGGTLAVDLPALLGPLGDGALLLRRIVEHANPDRLRPAAQLVEFFLRPLFTVFRVLLDGYATLLPVRSVRDIAFEFTPELRPTGRVVLTAHSAPQDPDSSVDTAFVAHTVWSAARQLLAAFSRSGLDEVPRWPELAATVDRVAAEELRFLRERTVVALSGDHPLRGMAHTVDSAQTALLSGLLSTLEDRVRRRRADPDLPRPAVVFRLRSSETLPGYLDFLRDIADVGAEALIEPMPTADAHEPATVLADREVLAECEIVGSESKQDSTVGPVVVRFAADGPVPATAVIANFERLPSPPPPAHTPDGPALSHTHSIAELPLAALSARVAVRDYGAELSLEKSLALIGRLRAQAEESAVNTAAATRAQLRAAVETIDDEHLRTGWHVHHVLTRKQFYRGSRSTYPLAAALHDILGFIRRGEPIQVVLPGFPVKQAESRLKAFGHRPDLAELAVLIRLGELAQAVRAFHRPGLRITALSDGLHFRTRPPQLVHEYAALMRDYLDLAGVNDFIELIDVDDHAARRLGPEVVASRAASRRRYRQRYLAAFAGCELREDPLWTLALAARRDPTAELVAALGGRGGPGFVDMFRSILHSVEAPAPAGHDQASWSKSVYADPYGVRDPSTSPEVREGRKRLLGKVWTDTVDYMSGLLSDRELGYDQVLPERIRLTLSTPSAGRCGFAPLGGAAVLPWHGTAALNRRGEVSVDFAISLCDQGFVPVRSPLLGGGQPWFMVPATEVQVHELARGGEVTEELLASVRLRRR